MSSLPTIRDIARALEAWAPPASAQSYDNVGLQVGDASREVEQALIALDLTPQVLEEAKTQGATLIITHHPLIFRPLRNVTTANPVSGLAFRLAEAGIALYSIHTNLDAAPAGVSFSLAEQLGLRDVQFLDTMDEALYKLVVFTADAEATQNALAEGGAHRLTVLPTAETTRLEAEVDRWHLKSMLAALPPGATYDVYPVQQATSRAGLGAIGTLEAPEPLPAFLARVSERLDAASLRYVGDPESTVQTVAVCGGSGSDFTRRALAAGADAYVTADVTYHKFFDVLDANGHPQMALIDAGHYETEAITERLLQHWLRERFPATNWNRTALRTSPMQTFVQR